jgi:hypothetical protein
MHPTDLAATRAAAEMPVSMSSSQPPARLHGRSPSSILQTPRTYRPRCPRLRPALHMRPPHSDFAAHGEYGRKRQVAARPSCNCRTGRSHLGSAASLCYKEPPPASRCVSTVSCALSFDAGRASNLRPPSVECSWHLGGRSKRGSCESANLRICYLHLLPVYSILPTATSMLPFSPASQARDRG